MKRIIWLIPFLLVVLSGCLKTGTSVTIIADYHTYKVVTSEHIPVKILALAKLTMAENDSLLYLGSPVPLNSALPVAASYTLTIRRAFALTLVTPEGQKTIQTSAQSVGQALAEAGYTLYSADRIDPPAETPIEGPLTVTYQPSRKLVVTGGWNAGTSSFCRRQRGAGLGRSRYPAHRAGFQFPARNRSAPR